MSAFRLARLHSWWKRRCGRCRSLLIRRLNRRLKVRSCGKAEGDGADESARECNAGGVFVQVCGSGAFAAGRFDYRHEAGHFRAARACGISVQEFSMGMGPLIANGRAERARSSVRLLPIGGKHCQFYGEDEDELDPRAFNNQAIWKRAVTAASGPLMNSGRVSGCRAVHERHWHQRRSCRR